MIKDLEVIDMDNSEEIDHQVKERIEIKPILAGSMWPMILEFEIGILNTRRAELVLLSKA